MATPFPAVHSVHIYDSDSDLITRLGAIISSSLRLGDSALIVATPEHRAQLVQHLREAGVDVRSCVRDGRYTMLDAREALSLFLRDGRPDSRLFGLTVGATLDSVRQRAAAAKRNLTVFGEMVALLWRDGLKEAALELEALWNAALRERTFHLHCAYPRELLHTDRDVAEICGAHSHILGYIPRLAQAS